MVKYERHKIHIPSEPVVVCKKLMEAGKEEGRGQNKNKKEKKLNV